MHHCVATGKKKPNIINALRAYIYMYLFFMVCVCVCVIARVHEWKKRVKIVSFDFFFVVINRTLIRIRKFSVMA